jgi:uracil-DNA glycosylase
VRELAELPPGAVVVALGSIAHAAILLALDLKQAAHRFRHGAEHALPRRVLLIDSYHCSRLNTNTGRLTAPMFSRIFARARHLIGD